MPDLLRLRNHSLKILLVVFLFILFALELAHPIVLPAADIGRHIKNGELILQGHWDILYKNFYSFTHPDYPFLNHHWLFGVFSYAVYKVSGFAGLSVGYIAIMLGTLSLFLRAALLRGHFSLAVFFAFLALPILADRQEIRPEGLSLLFMGLYFCLLTKLSLGQVHRVAVFAVLGVAQLIWVNTHIFFFMGPLLTALFLWEGHARGCKVCVRNLWPLLWGSLAVSLINPSFVAGALTPLNVFKTFGYPLAENQSVFFMMHRFPQNTVYAYFLAMVVVVAVGMILALRARGWKTNLPFVVLGIFAACAGLKAVRLMTPFAFLMVPLAAFFYGQVEGKWPATVQQRLRALILAATCVLGVFYALGLRQQPLGIGLVPGVNSSADFFKQNNLKGPVFSNYDIGGYLIYHLYGREAVFVDNRQEAFPPAFFTETYIPMQENRVVWDQEDTRYRFNVVYFYRHDFTPWGQKFLIQTLKDPGWAPVFVDAYTIIFARRQGPNQGIIDRFELPQSMFAVTHPQSPP